MNGKKNDELSPRHTRQAVGAVPASAPHQHRLHPRLFPCEPAAPALGTPLPIFDASAANEGLHVSRALFSALGNAAPNEKPSRHPLAAYALRELPEETPTCHPGFPGGAGVGVPGELPPPEALLFLSLQGAHHPPLPVSACLSTAESYQVYVLIYLHLLASPRGRPVDQHAVSTHWATQSHAPANLHPLSAQCPAQRALHSPA